MCSLAVWLKDQNVVSIVASNLEQRRSSNISTFGAHIVVVVVMCFHSNQSGSSESKRNEIEPDRITAPVIPYQLTRRP